MKALSLVWNRCRGNAWCQLPAVDLFHRHFEALEGVYIIWHGGSRPQTVSVGQGRIRERLVTQRGNPEVMAYKAHELYVTWAPVESSARDGVERFLIETLRPLVKAPAPSAVAIEVNLPGRAPAQGPAPDEAQDDASRPEQIWQEMVVRAGERPSDLSARDVEIVEPPQAPVAQAPAGALAAPKVKRLSNLQKLFNEMVDKSRQQKPRGFFGGGGEAKPQEDETLVISAVQLIMEEAVRMRASDIHIEPLGSFLRVRFRIDGILEEVLEVPRTLDIRVVSRIRVMCALDPEQGIGTAKPQDGRMVVIVDAKEADLRLSTFPTSNGDKAVLRIIPRDVRVPRLEELGISPKNVVLIRQLIERPQGMIIMTGPTGSGKSTTLYTALQTLNDPGRNIVTLEDPIEHKIEGITQGSIQPKVGFTFAQGLRSILRQDPNIVMVGEIRDPETSEIALSAALTGHMLFTTLHTNSALGAITRLLDMGLEPFLIAAALTAVFAQRLARRVCPKCREAYQPAAAELSEIEELIRRAGINFALDRIEHLSRGRGCEACRGTGLFGRMLVFEIVALSPNLRGLIMRKAGLEELRKAAIHEGMQTLLADGLEKTADGLTTLSELIRVVGAGD